MTLLNASPENIQKLLQIHTDFPPLPYTNRLRSFVNCSVVSVSVSISVLVLYLNCRSVLYFRQVQVKKKHIHKTKLLSNFFQLLLIVTS